MCTHLSKFIKFTRCNNMDNLTFNSDTLSEVCSECVNDDDCDSETEQLIEGLQELTGRAWSWLRFPVFNLLCVGDDDILVLLDKLK